jgi:hypothetical protein
MNGPRYWLMTSLGKVDRESVDRKAVSTFDAGREIYELVDPDDQR